MDTYFPMNLLCLDKWLLILRDCRKKKENLIDFF